MRSNSSSSVAEGSRETVDAQTLPTMGMYRGFRGVGNDAYMHAVIKEGETRFAERRRGNGAKD
jgi:hypothetical protein